MSNEECLSNDECLSMVLATIQEVTGVGSLAADQDFYDAGVTSVQALPLLIELETKFDCIITGYQVRFHPECRWVVRHDPRN